MFSRWKGIKHVYPQQQLYIPPRARFVIQNTEQSLIHESNPMDVKILPGVKMAERNDLCSSIEAKHHKDGTVGDSPYVFFNII